MALYRGVKIMSGSPTRWPGGFTQANSEQPLGQIGIPDPFFYCYYEDDFVPYNSALYTATLDGGTAAQTVANGAGGRVLLTSAAVNTDYVQLQLTSAPFQYTAGKKLFYLTRIQIGAKATTTFIAGLVETEANPTATITDGIYFKYTANGTTISLIAVTGSTVIGTATIALSPTNNTDLDLGFYVDRHGNIVAFVGSNLEGNEEVQYSYVNLGPIAKLWGAGQSVAVGTPQLTGAISTVLLNPTIAVIAASAAAATLVADFQAAGTER